MQINNFNKPSFGCSNCKAVVTTLQKWGVPEVASKNYLKTVAPEAGKIVEYAGIEVQKPHAQLAFDIFDAVLRDGKRISDNVRKNY